MKIPLDKVFPAFNGLLPGFGVAQTGKVNEEEISIDPIEIDALRFPGRCTGPGQLPAAGEPVDEARLAHIRPAGKYDFGNPLSGEITFRDGTNNKFGLGHRES
jgi:hypothetical protein